MLSLQSLADEYRPFHNDICVIHDHLLARLVGVAEDESDFYYKVIPLGGKASYCSAVGSCVSLKAGYPDPERYACLDRTFALNGAVPSPEFEVTVLPPLALSGNLPGGIEKGNEEAAAKLPKWGGQK